jgi:CheY-like chemotaxis protein
VNKVANKILLIENEKDIRLELAAYFKNSGYTVLSAKHAEEAIKILETKLPDLVITEITMPGMDGFQFLEIFKKLPGTPLIPVIFLSEKIDTATLKKIIHYNVDNYLKKPFEISELNKIVTELLIEHKIENFFSPTK